MGCTTIHLPILTRFFLHRKLEGHQLSEQLTRVCPKLTAENGNVITKHDHWLVGQGHPSEKYEFVNWDDELPNISGKIKNGNQTTNQIMTIMILDIYDMSKFYQGQLSVPNPSAQVTHQVGNLRRQANGRGLFTDRPHLPKQILRTTTGAEPLLSAIQNCQRMRQVRLDTG